MGQTLDQVGPVVHVAEVVNYGEKIVLPDGMKIPDAMDILQRRQKFLSEKVILSETFDAFPWDGANALYEVLQKKFAWVPPSSGGASVKVAVGFNEHKFVPWGAFEIPGIAGSVNCDVSVVGGRFQFAMQARVFRYDEATIKDIFAEVRAYLKTNSIYRGKAIKIRFLDDDGDRLPMPDPQFMDTSKITRSMAVYSDHISDAIETNLLTPIERVDDLLANGLPIKRSVLLGGTYGTGKTLAATVASKVAVDSGNTYLYIPRADELKEAIEFAKQYQSPACVIFCEDIDRVISGERTIGMDDLLNIVDGIDTKQNHLIMVFTTNDLEAINPAMIRPGRLDSVIEVTPPDAKAVERLLRLYAGDTLPLSADLTMAGEALKGQIPAVVAEAVKRAKLVMLKKSPKGAKLEGLTEDAIIEASVTLQGQMSLLQRLIDADQKEAPTVDSVMTSLVKDVVRENLHPGYLVDND